MSHKITTTVTHTFDLTEVEQYDYKSDYRDIMIRVRSITVRIVDGSVSIIMSHGRQVLKDGELGKVGINTRVYKPRPPHVLKILRAHGIRVDDAS